MRPAILTAFLLGLLGLFGLQGCGWRAGVVAPEGFDTVGVEVVTRTRDVLERGLEPRLTDELSQAVSDLVGMRLVRPGAADLVVRGEITEYRRRGGVRSGNNVLLESAVRITVRAELLDRKAGVVVRPASSYVWSGYAVDDPVGEQIARDRALQYIAETLILELFQTTGSKDENPASTGE